LRWFLRYAEEFVGTHFFILRFVPTLHLRFLRVAKPFRDVLSVFRCPFDRKLLDPQKLARRILDQYTFDGINHPIYRLRLLILTPNVEIPYCHLWIPHQVESPAD